MRFRSWRPALWFLFVAGFVLSAPGAERPPGIGAAMEQAVQASEIAGAVTVVATSDRILHLEATGYADLTAKKPMTTDALFWIASMTKLVTGAAILSLQDEGRLRLDDPVAKYLPEFRDLRTPSGAPADLTLRQLLTHTSGLGEAPQKAGLAARDLAELVALDLRQPMQFEPGTKWKYCQAGLDTAAHIVEVISGETFDRFLAERFFQPLGMVDTTFYPDAAQARRLAVAYSKNKDTGRLEPVRVRILGERELDSHDRPPLGSGGLFSTAHDMIRFAQMLLNDGSLEGRRYLQPETARLMHTEQTAGIEGVFPPVKGYAWGVSCSIIREPQGVTAMFSPGTFGHSGAYGTHLWIDPRRRAIFLLLVQRTNFSTTDDNAVRRVFQQTAVEAVDARK